MNIPVYRGSLEGEMSVSELIYRLFAVKGPINIDIYWHFQKQRVFKQEQTPLINLSEL